CARLGERVLERPAVDGEQEIALVDDLAVLEMHLFEMARDTRAHLDRVDRNEAADIFVVIEDRALDGIGDRHRRRRGRTLCRLLALSATRQRGHQNGKGCKQRPNGPRHGFSIDGRTSIWPDTAALSMTSRAL